MHRGFRKTLLRHPLAYEALIVAKMVRKSWQVRSDAFFGILKRFPEQGLALDIGANRGQSALTISALRPRFKIYSFEPNSSCALGLGATQLKVGANLTVLFEGLGEDEAVSRYFEPCLFGFPLTTEGTFNRANLHERAEEHMRRSFELTNDEFDRNYAVRDKFFRVSTLDSLDLDPDFIKIDTQGFEAQCVKGGRETIDRNSPLIIAENNVTQFEEVLSLMESLAYGSHRYSAEGNYLVPATKEECRNLVDILWLRDCAKHNALKTPA